MLAMLNLSMLHKLVVSVERILLEELNAVTFMCNQWHICLLCSLVRVPWNYAQVVGNHGYVEFLAHDSGLPGDKTTAGDET